MSNVKIFVSHRSDIHSTIISNDVFVPVECGSSQFHAAFNANRDDLGENISNRKDRYSELTVQYWAWKNVKADYYGLCHYRRYFSFSPEVFCEDKYGFLNEKQISPGVADKYFLNDVDRIKNVVSKYDILVSSPFEVRKDGFKSVKNQWEVAGYLKKEDLDILIDVISEKTPEYLEAARKYLEGNIFYPCCLFIMNKHYFRKYSEWLFSVLFEVESRLDYSSFSEDRTRVVGHLGERMLGIFVTYIKSMEDLRLGVLQRVIYHQPCAVDVIGPEEANRVPVVFHCSNYDVPYLSVSIDSLLSTINPSQKLDVIIATDYISIENKRLLLTTSKANSNVTIKFLNIYHEDHRRFKLILPDILNKYQKLIYADVGTVFKSDISTLLKIDDNAKTITAVPDLLYQTYRNECDFCGNEAKDINGLISPLQYFSTSFYAIKTSECKDLLKNNEFQNYSESDVLNQVFGSSVDLMDFSWNISAGGDLVSMKKILKYAPLQSKRNYLSARNQPVVITYPSEKPWLIPETDLGHEFWSVAKGSVFYETILSRVIEYKIYTNNHKTTSFFRKAKEKIKKKIKKIKAKF